ncbi:heterokaryon incompatibility protein-domain-containing protein, partial [Cercophora newfieldiana]
MSEYIYEPLPPVNPSGNTPPYTRILLLFPPPDSHPHSPFRATLEVANIEETPPYEALSYTWGTQPPSAYIYLDNPDDQHPSPLPIKPNLASALHFLRPLPGSAPRRLWIDALCIDQSNVDERSRQVGYMRLVYQHCERVVAWIGTKGSEGVEMAFEAAKRLSVVGELVAEMQRVGAGDSGQAEGGADEGLVREMIANALASVPEGAMDKLAKLFEREYFCRSWVVQEIAVARVAMVKCEELEMGFSELASTVLFLFMVAKRDEIRMDRPLEVWYLISEFSRGSHVRMSNIPGSLGPLMDLLEMMRAYKATDSRDKIYSVLGICDEGLAPSVPNGPGLGWMVPGALKPDYTREIHEVYTDLARFLVSKSPVFLDVLSFVQHHTAPNLDPARDSGWYPSWVPKWFEVKVVSSFQGGGFKAGYMSEYFQSQVQRAISVPGSLLLDGFHVGTVYRVSEPMAFDPDRHSKTEAVRRAWAELLPNLQLTPRPTQQYINGEPLDVAFCKAVSAHPLGCLYGSIMADSMGFRFPNRQGQMNQATADRVSESAVTAFLAGINGDERSVSREADAARIWFWNAVGVYGHNRRVFLTREGHIGIGPTVMREGDEVVVLFGGRMPYVLRRGGERHHVFIGDCYIRDDEIMYGRTAQRVRGGSGSPNTASYEL